MKYSNVKAFEKHLETADPKHLADVYMILSKDSFERKSAVDKLIKVQLRSQKNPEMALKVFDGEKFSMEGLMQELNALPFFSDKRVVHLQNADQLNKKDIGQLEAYFACPNRTLCLILSGASIAGNTNYYKKAEKAGIILDIAEEKPWEKEKSMREWIFAKVAADGKRIDPQAVQMLQKQIGNDQALVNSEIEKLFCYVGDRQEITLADIAAISTSINIENAWQLCDAIFTRNANAALRISKALLADGTALLSLVRQIRSQVQTDYQICCILANGGGPAEITQQFPYMRGQILEKHIQAAQSYGLERFKKAMLKIDETESLAKNSQGDDDFLTEMLIAKLVT